MKVIVLTVLSLAVAVIAAPISEADPEPIISGIGSRGPGSLNRPGDRFGHDWGNGGPVFDRSRLGSAPGRGRADDGFDPRKVAMGRNFRTGRGRRGGIFKRDAEADAQADAVALTYRDIKFDAVPPRAKIAAGKEEDC